MINIVGFLPIYICVVDFLRRDPERSPVYVRGFASVLLLGLAVFGNVRSYIDP